MKRDPSKLELWGGVECTVNRVNDRFHDQLKRSGHLTRLSDIDRFAELGLTALRVPLLWELACSRSSSIPDWAGFDPMLERIRVRKMRVIAGLCHHGSGPVDTHLLDPNFEHALSRYAGLVAERYPGIQDYTPVNEPLTTARFSALYGHWYPHARDTAAFLRALVHQCRATVRAMRAIRVVQPQARLIQTEDIATVCSTPSLQYQADYENARRFLSLDLLCGHVDSEHPLYDHLLSHGVAERELAWFCDNPCAPDLIGVNYYFTSDRYLDDELARHPSITHGGNGHVVYADVDAARAAPGGILGHRKVLETVWERYHIPIAMTEVHAGCTREEQLRWLHEAFRAACDAKSDGVDVRALTAWALLGSFDWNSLVRVEAGVYEPGVFDLRSADPRPTALASMITSLSEGGDYEHPVLGSPGWWRRTGAQPLSSQAPRKSARPIAIIGETSALADAFSRACVARGLEHRHVTTEMVDPADSEKVKEALNTLSPWAVIHTGSFGQRGAAAQPPPLYLASGATSSVVLGEACQRLGVRLLTFSSETVFDGKNLRPYVESDAVSPICAYGTSQVEAERGVLSVLPDALVVRTSAVFDPWDQQNLMTQALSRLSRGCAVYLHAGPILSPTYLPHLVDACLDLLIDGASKLWHLTNPGEVTWPAIVERMAVRARLPGKLVKRHATNGLADKVPAPFYGALGSERGTLMPALDDALDRYLWELRQAQPHLSLHPTGP